MDSKRVTKKKPGLRNVHAARAEHLAYVLAILPYASVKRRWDAVSTEYARFFDEKGDSAYPMCRSYSNARLFWELIESWREGSRHNGPIVRYLVKLAYFYAQTQGMKNSNYKYKTPRMSVVLGTHLDHPTKIHSLDEFRKRYWEIEDLRDFVTNEHPNSNPVEDRCWHYISWDLADRLHAVQSDTDPDYYADAHDGLLRHQLRNHEAYNLEGFQKELDTFQHRKAPAYPGTRVTLTQEAIDNRRDANLRDAKPRFTYNSNEVLKGDYCVRVLPLWVKEYGNMRSGRQRPRSKTPSRGRVRDARTSRSDQDTRRVERRDQSATAPPPLEDQHHGADYSNLRDKQQHLDRLRSHKPRDSRPRDKSVKSKVVKPPKPSKPSKAKKTALNQPSTPSPSPPKDPTYRHIDPDTPSVLVPQAMTEPAVREWTKNYLRLPRRRHETPPSWMNELAEAPGGGHSTEELSIEVVRCVWAILAAEIMMCTNRKGDRRYFDFTAPAGLRVWDFGNRPYWDYRESGGTRHCHKIFSMITAMQYYAAQGHAKYSSRLSEGVLWACKQLLSHYHGEALLVNLLHPESILKATRLGTLSARKEKEAYQDIRYTRKTEVAGAAVEFEPDPANSRYLEFLDKAQADGPSTSWADLVESVRSDTPKLSNKELRYQRCEDDSAEIEDSRPTPEESPDTSTSFKPALSQSPRRSPAVFTPPPRCPLESLLLGATGPSSTPGPMDVSVPSLDLSRISADAQADDDVIVEEETDEVFEPSPTEIVSAVVESVLHKVDSAGDEEPAALDTSTDVVTVPPEEQMQIE